MTAGDVININMSGVNSYQPAATIEIIVLMNMTAYEPMYYGHQDGVTITAAFLAGSAATPNYTAAAIGNKLGFTNTNYYYNSSPNVQKGFSGIQVK